MKNTYLFRFVLIILISIFIFLSVCYLLEINLFNRTNFINLKSIINSKSDLNLINFYPNNTLINKLNNNIIAYLSIPQINLYNIPIEYGTNSDILSRAIGLFENSNITSGNICLAAHNRSYTVSYFNKLWMLKTGDEIILRTKNETTIYTVIFSTEILSNDWTYLQNENENYVTCITCIDGKPNKRLCVRAIKK